MSVTNVSKRRGTILDEIMAYHREQLPKIKRDLPIEDLRALSSVSPPTADFYTAITQPGVSLIAECKKASPSKGLIANKYDPVELAKTYIKAGASAISVLTDGRHFQGALSDLRDVKEITTSLKSPITQLRIPLLRKDFTFDPYHLYEARTAGADVILLIAAVLGQNDLAKLLKLTRKLGMTALIEVHTEAELQKVLPLQPRVIGVNNRNLQTFEVDFENTARLRDMIPAGIATVGESGLKTEADVQRMKEIGVDAVLVGETLMRSKDVFATATAFVKAGRPSPTIIEEEE